jgi:hypothetical protein
VQQLQLPLMLMTKALAFVILCAAVSFLAGCATPQQTYLSQHPELSAEQRKIIAAARLSDRDAVAGMTREQIRLTMGTDPTQLTSINGEDAWVWVQRKGGSGTFEPMEPSVEPGAASFSKVKRSSDPVVTPRVEVRTTVFFQGNLATHVDVTESPL